MSKHQEQWGGFPANYEDGPALVMMDLGWADHDEPDASRPMLVRLSVPFPASVSDDGEGLAAFLDSLDPFEESLSTLLGSRAKGALVATLVTQTHRWFVYYTAESDDIQSLVAGPASKATIEPEVHVDEDPEWEFYGELFPDLHQQRYMGDQSVIAQLAEHGDDLEAPRPIEHLAIMPDAKSRDKFVKWCAANGFTVTDAPEKESEDYDGFAVEFTHVGPALIDEIWDKTCQATDGAEECGGEYDGWQTAIVTKEK